MRVTFCILLAGFLTLIAISGISFIAGRLSLQSAIHLVIPIHTTSQIFRYNAIFSSPPSNESNSAWDSLFPAQGGFFKHPTLAPQRSAFAVFHQLHCLNGIRMGYYNAWNAATEGRKLVEDEIPMMYSPPHIRHCIDLLRQALICQPDITIEVKNEDVGGVTGFGTTHQCQDWAELMSFTKKWETYMQDL